jgi:PKD repeat protein
VGATQQFTVEAWDANDSLIPDHWVNANWTTLNSDVATVDPLTGRAAAVGIGQVTIQADVDGVVEYALLTVAVPGLSRVNLWAEMNTGLARTHPVEDLWGTSATDVFAAGHGGKVLHYDGTSWSTSFSSIDFLNMDVWGSSEHDVFVVGWAAKILHYDGTLWSLMTSGMSNMLSAVWGASPDDIYAVSWDGTIVHFDGASWSPMESENTLGLHGVWGTSASDVYAVGGDRALHYDGTSWNWTSPGLGRNIEAVWGVSGTDIYAAGVGGDVFHYDGTGWTHVAWGAPIRINAIWGSSNSDIYFAGADTLGNAAVFHNDGSHTWTLTRSPALQGLWGIWGAPTGEVFASGGGGTILRGYRGGTVAVTPPSATVTGTVNRVQLTALAAEAGGSPVSGVPFTWTSSDSGVATVDPAGLVTGVANGTATIRAMAFGGASATATVTVALTQMPPSAVIDSPEHDTTLTLGEMVTFLGTASDVDGTIASHHWDFGDGNGASVEDPGVYTYVDVGTYTVTYRVTDDHGASSPTARVVITVVFNQEPSAAIASPAEGATFAEGETIAFAGSGTDHEDGDLTGASLVWTSSLDGQIGTGTSFTRDDLSVGTHHITLTASDSEGGRGTAGVTITVSGAGSIVPGDWHAPTAFGSVDFTVNPQGTAITFFRFSFVDYACGPVSGSWTTEISGGTWPITNRQFSFDYTFGSERYVFAGTFSDSGTEASGTWDVTFYGTTCSGTWQGAPL